AEEHRPDVRHRLLGADDDRAEHQQSDAPDDRGADGAGHRLPRPRMAALGADPAARGSARPPGGALMPDWAGPVARYVLEQGLPGTLRVAAIAVLGSALIGITLGTLITIRFLPPQALIRLYIEVFRGLPILVTIFIVFFGLPSVS